MIGFAAGILGLAFFASSLGHAMFNDVYEQNSVGNLKLLHIHYAVLYAFILATLSFAGSSLGALLPTLALILPFWLCIHGLRFGLDWADGLGSRNSRTIVRHLNDALANLITVIFVLVAARSGNRWLTFIALALSIGMVGKEILYRTVTDVVKRLRNKRKTTQQGTGRASPRHFAAFHSTVSSFKSLAYMLLGFALIYRCLGALSLYYAGIIFGNGANLDDLGRALGFTITNFQITASGGGDNLLRGLTGLEGICAILMTLSFGAIPFKRG